MGTTGITTRISDLSNPDKSALYQYKTYNRKS